MVGGVVRGVGGPAGPDDAQPGASEDAEVVWMTLATSPGLGVDVGGPGGAVARVVDQDLKGFACAGVGGPAEADGFVLARGLSDGRGAAFGSGLLDVGGPVQEGANLGEDLTQVDVLT